jgi:hypothetical protein
MLYRIKNSHLSISLYIYLFNILSFKLSHNKIRIDSQISSYVQNKVSTLTRRDSVDMGNNTFKKKIEPAYKILK